MPRITHRVKATLSETIDHRVKLYSVAAAAAGVSMLALAQPADAEVVITNKTIPIPFCVSDRCSVSIDLNGDGVNDFQFSLYLNYVSVSHSTFLNVTALHGGGVVGTQGGAAGPYASCLLRGAKIGPSNHFLLGAERDTVEGSHSFYSEPRHSSTLFGKWGGNHPNRFLGVKFLIKGATHYGWIRLTVDSKKGGGISGTITEYGYETIANKSLGAGLKSTTSDDTQASQKDDRPGGPSLGMLALGADGLALWRREETLAA